MNERTVRQNTGSAQEGTGAQMPSARAGAQNPVTARAAEMALERTVAQVAGRGMDLLSQGPIIQGEWISAQAAGKDHANDVSGQQQTRASRGKVVFFDPNPQFLTGCVSVLNMYGFDANTVGPDRAEKWIREFDLRQPDAIVIEPGLDQEPQRALKLILHVRAARDVPIIILTGSEPEYLRSFQGGRQIFEQSDVYLLKPNFCQLFFAANALIQSGRKVGPALGFLDGVRDFEYVIPEHPEGTVLYIDPELDPRAISYLAQTFEVIAVTSVEAANLVAKCAKIDRIIRVGPESGTDAQKEATFDDSLEGIPFAIIPCPELVPVVMGLTPQSKKQDTIPTLEGNAGNTEREK